MSVCKSESSNIMKALQKKLDNPRTFERKKGLLRLNDDVHLFNPDLDELNV